MNKKKKRLLTIDLLFMVLLIMADQFTKYFAVANLKNHEPWVLWDGVFELHYLENRGAAWGIFQNAFWLFFIITIVVVGVMVYFYARIPFTRRYWYLRFTIILLSSGAIGNFIDRACWHYVVDFIYVEAINFPVFNVADCCVTVGALCLVAHYIVCMKREKDAKAQIEKAAPKC